MQIQHPANHIELVSRWFKQSVSSATSIERNVGSSTLDGLTA